MEQTEVKMEVEAEEPALVSVKTEHDAYDQLRVENLSDSPPAALENESEECGSTPAESAAAFDKHLDALLDARTVDAGLGRVLQVPLPPVF